MLLFVAIAGGSWVHHSLLTLKKLSKSRVTMLFSKLCKILGKMSPKYREIGNNI
jgi:hypothetical protein